MKSIAWTVALAAGLVVLAAPGIARAEEVSRWPSEQEQALTGLDAQLIEIQQRLFTAKQTNDVPGTEIYTAQFNTCQEQRLTILRSMGLVTDHGNDD